jgi:hypothetical protein
MIMILGIGTGIQVKGNSLLLSIIYGFAALNPRSKKGKINGFAL